VLSPELLVNIGRMVGFVSLAASLLLEIATSSAFAVESN
jgi:hypothetical protein